MPIAKAKEVYQELRSLYNEGYQEPEMFLAIVKNYVNVKTTNFISYKVGFTFERNGKEYTAGYSTLKNPTLLNMFIEDIAMAVYRLYEGEGYNTYTLVDELELVLKEVRY